MSDIHLPATDLFSKWGFDDGDLCKDFYYEVGEPEFWNFGGARLCRQEQPFGFSHCLLIELVEKRLLPALPRRVRTFCISTLHNPIRAEDDESSDGLDNVVISIARSEVLRLARDMTRSPA